MSLRKFTSCYFLAFILTLTTSGISAGDNKDNIPTYLNITVPETELITQFHGDPDGADLRLFMAGNQFVVMDLLVDEFKRQNPKIKNIFYVTIPPGQLLSWILNGGIHIKGEEFLGTEGFKLRVMPDVYTTVNKGHMDDLFNAGLITRYYTYAQNRLVMMVKNDDPLAGQQLSASQYYNLMADPSVTLSEPDIITQGVERHFWQMYVDTSKRVFPDDPAIQALVPTMFNPNNLPNDPANSLRRIVYYDKVSTGATSLTNIHHLETPAALRVGTARMGGVWVTEVLYQQNRLGATDISMIEINDTAPDGAPLDRRTKVNYLATIVEGVMDDDNQTAAKKWITFLRSSTAQAILANAGFITPGENVLTTPFIYPNSDKNSRIGNY
jgi:ABC-type molybdate transport system substrate-binding protein